MEKTLSMNIENSLCQLFSDMPDFPFGESLPSLFSLSSQFIEVLLNILKNKVGLVDNPNNFLKSNNIRVIHFSESLDLCQLKALFPGAILFLESFDGNNFLGLLVLSHFNIPERSCPQFLDNLVLLHDYLNTKSYLKHKPTNLYRHLIKSTTFILILLQYKRN